MSDTFADATGERAQESEPICIHQLLKIICALWVAGAALLSLVGRAFHRRAIPNMKWAKSLQKATVQNKLLWNECPIKSLAQPMPAHIYQQSHRLLADIGGIHHIACARNGAIEVWNLRTCQQIFTLGQGAKSPYRLSFIECNGIPHLAGALEEGKLLVWNLNTGNLVHSIDVGQPIYAVVTSHSTRLVTQGKFNLQRWDVASGLCVRSAIDRNLSSSVQLVHTDGWYYQVVQTQSGNPIWSRSPFLDFRFPANTSWLPLGNTQTLLVGRGKDPCLFTVNADAQWHLISFGRRKFWSGSVPAGVDPLRAAIDTLTYNAHWWAKLRKKTAQAFYGLALLSLVKCSRVWNKRPRLALVPGTP